MVLSLIYFLLLIPSAAFSASGDQSQTFTLEGELYNSPIGTTPFTGEADIQVRILDESKNCVLYAEEQHIDTTTSSGIFNIEVGSSVADPDGKRIGGSDSGNSMAQVFQNRLPINATGAGCGGPTFTPTIGGGEGRYLEISVTPTATGLTDVLSPDIYLGTVPSAITSETLQGLYPSNFAILKPGTTELTQANLETVFSLTNYPLLLTAIAGGGGGGATTSTTDTTLNADSDANGTGSLLFQTRSTTRAEVKNDGDFAVDTSTFYVESTSNRVGIGSTVPSFDLSFGGDVDRILGLERHSTANTAGNDITINSGGATTGATDKTGGDLYLASGVATGTGSSNIYLQTATAAAAGTADNSPTTKLTILGNGNVGIGTAAPISSLHVSGASTVSFGMTIENTTSSAVARASLSLINSSGQSATVAANSPGVTDPGANMANSMALRSPFSNGINLAASDALGRIRFYTGDDTPANMRMIIDAAGNVGVGTAAPTATLHLKAGTAAVNTAPLKLTSGVNLTTPEAGAIEYDGTNLFYTDSTLARRTLSTTSSSLTSISSIANSGGNITLSPITTSGSVIIDSGTPSINSTSGALRIAGGAGITGDLFTGASVNVGSSLYVSTNGYIPQVYGSSAAAGNIRIDGTSDASKGYVLLNSAGGNVGIGTTTPAFPLDVNGNINVGGTANAFVFHAGFGTASEPAFNMGGSGNGMFGTNSGNDLSLATGAAERLRITSIGNVGIGTTAPTAVLNLKAGTATAGTAPLKLTAGTNLTTPEAGAIEFDGTNLFYTDGTATRRTVAYSGATGAAILDGGNTNGAAVSVGTTDNFGLTFKTNNIARVNILNGGQIGVGGTPSTVQKLLVTGSSNTVYTSPNTGVSNGANIAIGNSNVTTGTGSYLQLEAKNGNNILTGAYMGVVSNATDYLNNIVIGQQTGSGAFSERVRIDTAGNVGIGTTSPTAALMLKAGTATAGTAPLKLTAGTNMTTPEAGAIEFDGTNLFYTNSSNARQTLATTTSASQWVTNVNDIGYTTGRVGIGTTSPTTMLHIRKSSGASNVRLESTTGRTYDVTSDTTGLFRIVDNGSSNAVVFEGLTGNVGIGTTTPGYKLDIAGDVNVTGNFKVNGTNITTAGGDFLKDGTVAMTGAFQGIAGTAAAPGVTVGGSTFGFYSSGSNSISFATGSSERIRLTNGIIQNTTSNSYYLSGGNSAAFPPYTFNDGTNTSGLFRPAANSVGVSTAGVERMRVDATGSVGIGTTPSTKLHVLGSSGATIATFADGGATTCTVTPASTGFACSSDERLKKDIEDFSDLLSLEKVLQLKTVTYNWRSVDNGRHTGYIAQEIEKVAPEFVRTGEDGFKQVSYSGFIPWITGAIKALYAEFKKTDSKNSREIASLKSKVAQSDTRAAEIEAKAKRLEKDNATLKMELEKQNQELRIIKKKLGL